MQVTVARDNNCRSCIVGGCNDRNAGGQSYDTNGITRSDVLAVDVEHCELGVAAQIGNSDDHYIRSNVASFGSDRNRDIVVTSVKSGVARNHSVRQCIIRGRNNRNRASSMCNCDHVARNNVLAVYGEDRKLNVG